MSSQEIAEIVPLLPPSWGDQRPVVAILMAYRRIPIAKIAAIERTIPPGLWPHERAVISFFMAVTGESVKDIRAAETRIPPGDFPETRGLIAAILAHFNTRYETIRATAAALPAEWGEGQRGEIAAVLQGFALAQTRRSLPQEIANIKKIADSMPPDLWKGQRAVLATHISYFESENRPGVNAADRRLLNWIHAKELAAKLPASLGPQRSLLGTLMLLTGVSWEQTQMAERTLPPGKWPNERFVIAHIMAKAGLTYDQLARAEAELPPALRGEHSGLVATIITARKLEPGEVVDRMSVLPSDVPLGERGVVAAVRAAYPSSSQDVAGYTGLLAADPWAPVIAANLAGLGEDPPQTFVSRDLARAREREARAEAARPRSMSELIACLRRRALGF